MSITVNCFATLAHFSPPERELPAALGLTMGKLVDILNIPRDQVATVFVNGLHADWDTPVADGDRVGIFPAVGGG